MEDELNTIPESVVTIDSQDTAEFGHDTLAVRQELLTSQIRRRLLTGRVGGVERTESGVTVAVIDYKGYRVVIPVSEMMILSKKRFSDDSEREHNLWRQKILSGMLGAEIDFVVRGVSNDEPVAAASRKEAMLIKRRRFYVDKDDSGKPVIYPGRIVQARVIGVHEKGIHIEAFGTECTVFNRNLSWDWIGDARERYSVGETVLVRISAVDIDTDGNIEIEADTKSLQENDARSNLSKCKVQSKYVGTVIDVVRGMPRIRLLNGANALAHTCIDRRTPGKKDEVSFVVTNIDERRGVAMGVITRIIRQNI